MQFEKENLDSINVCVEFEIILRGRLTAELYP
ncbi:hypothetical protein SAMN04489757_10338 [Anaerocolumna aminovalerica]|jgi:hypothetical protein|uniref:Uncharacterized protein n=1 Tax=Anaerocolumna aminovalerica TaxID=1527 RepID=A0A1I5CFP5_9FIRM|nr:hypothetical protein SAMN04489757_10338 [Anaerocolumna aminovalerica]